MSLTNVGFSQILFTHAYEYVLDLSLHDVVRHKVPILIVCGTIELAKVPLFSALDSTSTV